MSEPFDVKANTRLCRAFSTKLVAKHKEGPKAYAAGYEALMNELLEIYNPRAMASEGAPHPPVFVDRLAPLVAAAEDQNQIFGYAAMREFLVDEGLLSDPAASPTPPTGQTKPPPRPTPVPVKSSKASAPPPKPRKVIPEVVIPPHPAGTSKRARSPADSEVIEVRPRRRTNTRPASDGDSTDEDEEEPRRPAKKPKQAKSKPTVSSDDDDYVEFIAQTKVAPRERDQQKETNGKGRANEAEVRAKGKAGGAGSVAKQESKSTPDNAKVKGVPKKSGPPGKRPPISVGTTAPSAGASSSKAAPSVGGPHEGEEKKKGKGRELMDEEEFMEYEQAESDEEEAPLIRSRRAAAYKATIVDKIDKRTFEVFDRCRLCASQGYDCTYTLGPIRRSREGAMVTCNKCRDQKKKCEGGAGGMTLHTALGKYKAILQPPPSADPTVPAAGTSAEGSVPPTVGDLFTTLLRELRGINDRVGVLEQAIKELAPPATMEYTPPLPIVATLLDKVQALVLGLNNPPPAAAIPPPSPDHQALATILARLANIEASLPHGPPSGSREFPPRPPSPATKASPPTEGTETPKHGPEVSEEGPAEVRDGDEDKCKGPSKNAETEQGPAEDENKEEANGEQAQRAGGETSEEKEEVNPAAGDTEHEGPREGTPLTDIPTEDDETEDAPAEDKTEVEHAEPAPSPAPDGAISDEDMEVEGQSDEADPPPPSHPRNKLRSTRRAEASTAHGAPHSIPIGGGLKRKAEDAGEGDDVPVGGSKKGKTSKKIRA